MLAVQVDKNALRFADGSQSKKREKVLQCKRILYRILNCHWADPLATECLRPAHEPFEA
jgi:hypothetical protein